MPTWSYSLRTFSGDLLRGTVELPTVDHEVVEDWVDFNYDDCINVEVEMLEGCEHVDFDEWMDGTRRCLGCGLEVEAEPDEE